MAGWPPSSGVKRNPRTLPSGTSMPISVTRRSCYVAAARFFSQDLIADPKSADELERRPSLPSRVRSGPGRLRPGGTTPVNWMTRNGPAGESRLFTGCGPT